MATLEEFIITLKSMDDLDQFYNEMETSGGAEFIPDRIIPVYLRRPISRNTHYMLTSEEALTLEKDPRVDGITIAKLAAKSIKPYWINPSENFDKSSSLTSNHYNWGLKRCTDGIQTASWGSNSTASLTGTATYNLSGKNVDVVIVDGHFNPAHPEFAKNSDGTGGSRVNQFNWFSLNSTVLSIDNDGIALTGTTYTYTPYSSGAGTQVTMDNNHGCHVAGTVAGNSNGWARDANIYNISPYSTNPNYSALGSLIMWDYIRAFHRNKAVNPATGYKNPTICNCSYGSSLTFPDSTTGTGSVMNINYHGTLYGSGMMPMTATDMNTYKLRNTTGTATCPYYVASVVADMQQAIDDGIIIVGAAGNDSCYVDTQAGLDYNNYFYATYGGTNYIWYYNKGCAPGSASTVITVGAVGSTATEQKASFSNTGPGIDIFAPGQYITSSFNVADTWTNATDPRNSSYIRGKISGTSMASPQVAGVLACALQQYPNMKQADAVNYIIAHSKTGQLTSTSGGVSDNYDIQSASNRYLYAFPERKTTNYVSPKINFKLRPSTGRIYPRTKIRVYK